MFKYPESFKKLIESFEMYPGIGPRTAERLAYFTILNIDKSDAEKFSKNILDAIDSIKKCKVCGMLTDNEICDICLDEAKEKRLMIVESTKDVIAFEKTNTYDGKYHVLNGVVSPLNGIGPDEINLNTVFIRVKEENIKEVIIATSSTIEGEMTAMYIRKMLENADVKVYRIGYGLPAGANIEYADEITLMKALEGKREI